MSERSSTGCLLLVIGLVVTLGLSFVEFKYKTQLFNASLKAQNKITKPPKHPLFYIFKVFEWLLLGLSWTMVFALLYLEFDKVNAWKIVTGAWFIGFTVIYLNLFLTGARPLFNSNTLAASNCECSFGGADFYTAFVVFVWISIITDVVGDRDFIDVSLLAF